MKIAAEKGRKGHGRSRGHGRRREHYMAENPLEGAQIIVGVITGGAGAFVAELADRYLATHALTDKNAKDASGNELYADTPPTSGAYANLMNPAAIVAPMNITRWGVGAGILGLGPIVVAHWVRSPTGRAGLQMFGFGALLRTTAKGVGDLFAKLTTKYAWGQRLFDAEMRAASLNGSSSYPVASLPSTGLGRSALQPKPRCGCNSCKAGLGACCGQAVTAPPQPPPPPPPLPASRGERHPGLAARATALCSRNGDHEHFGQPSRRRSSP